MNINIEYTNKSPEGLRIVHITDLHISHADERESESKQQHAFNRRTKGFPNTDNMLEELKTFLQTEEYDVAVFTGDIIDFPSARNIELLHDLINHCKKCFYVLGNHDWAYPGEGGTYETKQQNILKFEKFLNKEDAEVSVLDIKGYRLIGFENTSGGYQITESQYERIVNALHTDRPTILCTHVPFYTETLTEDTVKYWKSNIVMGSPDFPPNESTQKLLDYLSTETNLVVAILTGHIHFNHEDYIFGTIPQYVTALSAEKNLRCITL